MSSLNLNNYFSPGPKNTLKLQKDFSFKNPWIQVYTNTTVDSWHVGEFSSATYFITVEYDSNQKETMQVLIVARPAQATFSIFGRTTIEHELITLTATVDNSQLTFSATAINGFSGAKLSFVASYIETIQPLTIPTVVSPSLPVDYIPIPPISLAPTGFGQISVSSQPDIKAAAVSDTVNFVAGSGVSIVSNNTNKSVTFSSSFPFFKNIQVAGQPTLIPPTSNSNLTYNTSNGISLTTDNTSNTITVGLGTVSSLSVSGSSTLNTLTTSGLLTASLGALVNNGLTVNNGTVLNNGTTINSGLTVNGSTTVTGVLTSNSNITSTVSVSSSNNFGSFNYSTLRYNDVNILANFSYSTNSYNQLVLENQNSGSNASTDIIVSNNLSTASTYYGDFGMNSSGYTGTLGTNSLNAANTVYLASASSDLVIGTFTNNLIRFAINNGVDAVTIDTSNTLNALKGFTSTGSTTINPVNANVIISPSGTGTVTISPSGTGTVTINPNTIGSIDNIIIGGTTPRVATFTTLTTYDATATNSVTTATLTATGLSDLNRSLETVVDTPSGSTTSYNFSLGSIFYHSTTPTTDWTAAFSNLPTTNGRTVTVNIIVSQGGTAYKITGCTIEGVSATIKWAGSFTPVGNASKIDIWAFTFIRRASSWTVLASQSPNFG